jgi:GAF domain-containing protein
MSAEDMIRDPRFCDTPMVTVMGLRFFAATPLRHADGRSAGALCLFDREPRAFGEGEEDLLEKMAREMMQELEAPLAGKGIGPRGLCMTPGVPA